MTTTARATEHVDVLVVGAGVSGIGAGHHLRTRFPERTFAILDAQPERGGTWWTHRFPGVRSDSDLYSYGYAHKPWRGPAIATAQEILGYLDEVIEEDDLKTAIRYRHRITAARWSSADRRWTVDVARGDTGETTAMTCGFLWMCAGYLRHDAPYTPRWPGRDRFAGPVVHPQDWPADLDVAGKRVVVIGSGATAATIVPALARTAAHVTMLQRSPTYFVPLPSTSELAVQLRALDVPEDWTHEIVRRSYIAQLDELARVSREQPEETRAMLREQTRALLPADVDVDEHFAPRYRPFQQRPAVVPDGDLFAAMREGTVSVVTDTVDTFTGSGIRTADGTQLDADVVVTATGFDLSVFGDVAFAVDGEAVDFPRRVSWRGVMVSGIPNMAYVFGYFRQSWTLRADLVSDLVCRLLARMDERGAEAVTPTLRPEDAGMTVRPWWDPDDFNAGYLVRAMDRLLGRGDREPWTHMHEYAEERHTLPAADLDDGTLLYDDRDARRSA